MKYIGYYDTEKNRRNMFLAGVNKMNYISYALNSIGKNVEIVSCSMNADRKLPAQVVELNDMTTVKFFKAYPTKRKYGRIANNIRKNLTLFLYLLKNVKRDEQILVYHSLGIMRCIYWAKKIKKFRLILEVEEFYNDVNLKSRPSKSFENKFIEFADKYIFITKLLNKKFNKNNKPYIVNHGTYKVEERKNVSFSDEKKHVVYAGTFDKTKGGAYAAISCAQFLTDDYHVHIIGFGTEKENADIKAEIDKINQKSSAIVSYDGLLIGNEYVEFLQKCHIGLSTQNPYADYNDTSFPSKILSYMSNGLRVVTVRIPAIETSAVSDDVFFYDEQTPEKIAETIKNIELDNNYDAREKIEKLNKDFHDNLKSMLEE